jgi:hypothetical protein
VSLLGAFNRSEVGCWDEANKVAWTFCKRSGTVFSYGVNGGGGLTRLNATSLMNNPLFALPQSGETRVQPWRAALALLAIVNVCAQQTEQNASKLLCEKTPVPQVLRPQKAEIKADNMTSLR